MSPRESLRPIATIAQELGIHPDDLVAYGHDKAKIELRALERPRQGKGRVVLVSAITPTAAGEGKTTISVGLAMGLRRLGRRAALCLREPSLGPVFGMKGGGTGGGKAQVLPADTINLHFTGDLHAIGSATNLLAALVDNELHFRSGLGLDSRRVSWRRCIDMNDRALRDIVVGLGGRSGSVPRESGFDITAASETMAVLCLSRSLEELGERLGRMTVGQRPDGSFVTVHELGVEGALVALLKDALQPNLVQTAEGGPALVHGGPFANIAHGCSSLAATKMAMHYADDVVTEAGFGFDLGGEKFLDIKCRAGGLWPRCVVLVATLRALKMHGGADMAAAHAEDSAALERGFQHLAKHIESVRSFGLEPVVALNVFASDTRDELVRVEASCATLGVRAAQCTAFADGGLGAMSLARAVAEMLDASDSAPPAPRYAYPLDAPYAAKLEAIAQRLYGARSVHFTPEAQNDLAHLVEIGYGGLPVCVAKTQLSLSDDSKRLGRPSDFDVTVREVRLSAGAGFVVALLGDIMTMPGLPKSPSAKRVRVEPDGTIRGLMQND